MAVDKETAFDHNMFSFYPRPSASSAVLLFLVVANGHIVALRVLGNFALNLGTQSGVWTSPGIVGTPRSVSALREEEVQDDEKT